MFDLDDKKLIKSMQKGAMHHPDADWRVFADMGVLASMGGPGIEEAVRQALSEDGHGLDDSGAYDALYRAVMTEWRDVFTRVFDVYLDEGREPSTDPVDAAMDTATKYAVELARVSTKTTSVAFLRKSKKNIQAAKAAYKKLGDPPRNFPLPEEWRDALTLAWAEWIGDPPPALLAMAKALWHGSVKKRYTEEEAAEKRGLAVPAQTVGVDHYSGISKTGECLSWALGGTGILVDGDGYTTEPGIVTCFGPVLTREQTQQMFLPLVVPSMPVAVQVSGQAPGLIRPTTAKLAVLALASAKNDNLLLCTLEALTRALHPYAKYRSAMCKDVNAALDDLAKIRTIFPDGTEAEIFSDVRRAVGRRPTPEMLVGWAPGRVLARATKHGVPAGYFLVNLSGIMRIKANRIQDLRVYLLAAAGWNRQRGGAVSYTLDQWAAESNLLSPSAASGSRRKQSQKRKLALESLERHAADGLIVLEKHGDQYLAKAPGPYREAWEGARKKGLHVRPIGDK